MSRGKFFIFVFFLLIFFLPQVKASGQILIVEVQIAGEKSDNDYIKIYNPLNIDLDISGYKLSKKTSNGTEYLIKVFPKGSKIPSKGYFIWANSDENFAQLIKADVWSKISLAKNNSIALLNPEGIIIDALAWGINQNPFVKGSVFPENPTSNQRIERKKINDNYLNTNNNSEDFYLNPSISYRLKNSQPSIFPINFYPDGIFINEILPNPNGPDETDEWIEIFNQNNFEVNLSYWQISDTEGKQTIYTFPKETKISPQGFLVLKRPETKITLNNNKDGLQLIQPDGKVIDSVEYEKAPKGQSYNKGDLGWFWDKKPTPGAKNNISIPEKKEIDSVKDLVLQQGLARTNNKSFNISLLLISLTISVFSGIIVLILKKKLNKSKL